MNSNTKMPIKSLYFILISCAIIIFSSSMEIMMKIKDLDLFTAWQNANANIVGTSEELFSAYVTINLSSYFSRVIVPIIFCIYSYYAYTKIRINGLFVFMWSVLIIGSSALCVITFDFKSIFYYINIIGYVSLILTLLSLVDIIQESKSK